MNAESARIRAQFSAPFDAVLHVLAIHDPEGLLAMGAPLDEYSPEANDFADRIRSDEPFTEQQVAEVWERWFGEPDRARTVATALFPDLLALHLLHHSGWSEPVPEAARRARLTAEEIQAHLDAHTEPDLAALEILAGLRDGT